MNTNEFFYVYDIYNKMVKLEDLTTTQIKAMINKYNKKVTITGISKLKKAELIEKIRNHPRIEVHEGDTVKLKLVKDKRTLAQKVKEEREKRKAKPQPQAEKPKPFASLEKKRATVKEIKEDKKENKKERIKKLEKEMKKSTIQAKVKALGQKQVIKKKTLASKIEKTAAVLKSKKPKIPKITITEPEKEKKKVMRVGGRFITVKPKEIKSSLPPIPKSKARIRVIAKQKPKPKPKAKAKEEPEPESEDSDNEEVAPPIKEIPKKLHSIWTEYMEYKVGDWYSPNDQNEELEQLEENEKNYFKALQSLQSKSNSVKERSESIQAKASYTDGMKKEFEENEGFKKLYKLVAPRLLKEYEKSIAVPKEKKEKKKKQIDPKLAKLAERYN